MTPQEFAIWLAYFDREPYGPFGDYYRMARLIAEVRSSYITRKSDAITDLSEVFPAVFAPTRREAEERARAVREAAENPREGAPALLGLAAALGARTPHLAKRMAELHNGETQAGQGA